MATSPRDHGRLAALAARQHGLFTTQQARECGVSQAALGKAASTGRYQRLAIATYRVHGAPTSWLQTVLAGVLAGGEHAMAARTTALALHGISTRSRRRRPHVLVPYAHSIDFGVIGVTAHRSRTLGDDERVDVGGIPCTSVERALVETGMQRPMQAWRELVAEALRDRSTSHPLLATHLERAGRIPHRRQMLATLDSLGPEVSRLRSGAELAFRDLLLAQGLPRPILNFELSAPDGRLIAEIDAAYPRWLLGFEIDGRPYHSLPNQLLRDGVRDLAVRELGWDLRRVPAELVSRQPQWVADRVRAAISDARRRARSQVA